LKYRTRFVKGIDAAGGPVTATFSEGSVAISITDIDTEASLSLSVVREDMSQLDAKWKTLIPMSEINSDFGYSAIMELDSPVLRVQLVLPDPCCLSKKITMDSFGNICFVPEQKIF
jgi:hypothetical protein